MHPLDARIEELRQKRKQLTSQGKELRAAMHLEQKRRHRLVVAAKSLSVDDLKEVLAAKELLAAAKAAQE